jgi:hypothetical protein
MVATSSGDLPFAILGVVVAVVTLADVLARQEPSLRGLAVRHVPLPVYRLFMGGSAVFILIWSIAVFADLGTIQAIGLWGAAGCLVVLLMFEAAHWVEDQAGDTSDDEASR